MTEPRLLVQAGLDHLAARLNNVISSRLEATLHGLEWTTVLTELDRIKGRAPKDYTPGDLQAQLRMLTERLGALGYPFDDQHRTVSVLGGELRIVRTRWAHQAEFTALDAWRANDFGVRLLAIFDDAEGLQRATSLRDQAFIAVVAESGFEPQPPPVAVAAEESPRREARDPEHIEPGEQALRRAPGEEVAAPTVGGNRRLAFEPWAVVAAGDRTVLDELPKKVAKELVRDVAGEITEYEGPIHLDRLTRLVGASFGVRRLTTTRETQIARQVKASGVHVDQDKFVWPSSIDPDEWDEFRPSASDVDRPFEHVSPIEIANAARALVTESGWSLDRLDTAILRTFGRSRRTTGYVRHLRRAGLHLSTAADAQRIDDHLHKLSGGVGLVVHRGGRRLLVGEMRANGQPENPQGPILIRGHILVPGSHHFDDLPYELLTWQITPFALIGSTEEGRPVRVSAIPPSDRTSQLLEYARRYSRTR